MSHYQDLLGNRYGKLLVIKRDRDYVSPKGQKLTRFSCKCDCGNVVSVNANSLKNGATKSCGCMQKEVISKNFSTHGKRNTRLYGVWRHIIERCDNDKDVQYHNYGGRGIKLCDEWRDFETFYNWAMKNGYDSKAVRGACTIDRIDVNGNYEPNNCRFVNSKVQVNNTRTNRYITYNSECKTISQWAEKVGIKVGTLYRRINEGWNIEKCLFSPIQSGSKQDTKLKPIYCIELDKYYDGIKYASKDICTSVSNLSRSLKSNGTLSAGEKNGVKLHWKYVMSDKIQKDKIDNVEYKIDDIKE